LSVEALVADSRRFFSRLDFAFKNFPIGVADGKTAGGAANAFYMPSESGIAKAARRTLSFE
jgi:hypothetical protein